MNNANAAAVTAMVATAANEVTVLTVVKANALKTACKPLIFLKIQHQTSL